MNDKSNQKENDDKTVKESWRKPLQVPPRSNSMRSFYRGAEDSEKVADQSNQTLEKEIQQEILSRKTELSNKVKNNNAPRLSPKEQGSEADQEIKKNKLLAAKPTSEANSDTDATDKLSKEVLLDSLGIEIEDLFDVHELLRGKSFDIYQTLMQSGDEMGRCKITQPELMKRTGIKNRRTFYKHEEWLIKLNLLEKRHLPGDHKGVVYRAFKMSEVLPISDDLLEKFNRALDDTN